MLRADTDRHYNCAQAVLLPFAREAGLDEETAYQLAVNFGGGMKVGSVYGPVTGALMAPGLMGADDSSVPAKVFRTIRKDMGELLRAGICSVPSCELQNRVSIPDREGYESSLDADPSARWNDVALKLQCSFA